MRVLYLVGTFKPACYKDGVIDTRLTPAPGVWNVVLKYAQFNSDRAYFYIASHMPSKTPGKVEYLPLEGIRGCLMVIHVASKISDLDLMNETIISLFSYDRTQMPVDAVLTVLPTPVYEMKRLLGMTVAREKQRPAVIVRATEGQIHGMSDEYGFVTADRVITPGLQMEEDILKMASKNYSFAAIKNARARFVHVSNGIQMPKTALSFDRGKVIGYFGRFDYLDNHVDKCFAAMDKVYSSGIVDEVIATSSKAKDAASPMLVQYPYVKFSSEKQDYVLKAQQARCNVMYLERTACPMAMIELMGYGLLPVVCKTDRSWVKHFFRKEFPDYPFLFDTTEEMTIMVKAIMENDAFYKKWAKRVSEHIQKNFDLVDLKRKMHDEVIKTVEGMPRSPLMRMTYEEAVEHYGVCRTIVDEVLPRLGREFTGEELLREAQRAKVTLVTMKGDRFIDNRSLFYFIEAAGYKDTMDSVTVRFKKGGTKDAGA